MIARFWSARAQPRGAAEYVEYFEKTLIPELAKIPGHRGALVMTQAREAKVEVSVITFWESMEAIARFAGEMIDRAIVEPEAMALLESYDGHVTHKEVHVDVRSA